MHLCFTQVVGKKVEEEEGVRVRSGSLPVSVVVRLRSGSLLMVLSPRH
jgi:hypothetical protein